MSGKCLCSWSFSNSVPCNRGYHIPTAKKSQAFYLCLSKTDISNCSSFIYYNWESCFLGDSEICLSIDMFFKDKNINVSQKKAISQNFELFFQNKEISYEYININWQKTPSLKNTSHWRLVLDFSRTRH